MTTPGFRLYLLSLLLWQHHYLAANAQEVGIPLQHVDGRFTVVTSSAWMIEQVVGDFSMHLDQACPAEERARADTDAIAYIQECMKLCPVSRNLPATVVKSTRLEWMA